MQDNTKVDEDDAVTSALADHFDLPAHPPYLLPEHLQAIVGRIFYAAPHGPGFWIELSPEERRAVAAEWDREHTVANKKITEAVFVSANSESLNNGHCISWRYWVEQMPTWNTAQAANLMCGLDPDVFENLDSQPNTNNLSDLILKAKKIQRLAETQGIVSFSPVQWVEWTDKHKLRIHDGLRIEVDAMLHSVSESIAKVNENLLEQVNQKYFGARHWVGNARIKGAVSPIELMALMYEWHHKGEKEKAIKDWYLSLISAVNKGQIIARDPDSLMELSTLPSNDEWILTLLDADKFLEPLGWNASATIQDVFNECFKADALPPTSNAGDVQVTNTSTTINKIKNRISILNAEIELAKETALDKTDPNSVWAKLFDLAELNTGCMRGTAEGEIKYMDSGEVKFFKKRSLNERMSRMTTHNDA